MALNCDPSALANAATCFDKCISPGDQPAVETYLLSLIAGGSTDPATLLNNARCFHSCIPKGEQLGVQTYLMAVIGKTSTDPTVLLNSATCFRSCIPQQEQPAVTLYILANQAGGSTDPATLANLARCFSSCIPKGADQDVQTYLLAVKAGLSADPSGLANTARCFSTCIPRGAQRAVQNYILCNFFFSINAGATDWANRVVANGGTMPSQATIQAQSDLLNAISSLSSRIWHLNSIVPDSFIAMRTPLIKIFGSDPWVRNIVGTGFAETVDVTGWIGNADSINGIVYDTGVNTKLIPSFGPSNGGVSLYLSNTTAASQAIVGALSPPQPGILLTPNTGVNSVLQMWNSVHLVSGAHPVSIIGFYSGSRISTNRVDIYFGNSITPWNSISSVVFAEALSPPNLTVSVGGPNILGSYATQPQKVSFVAIHDGFSSADGQILFNAAQAFRVAIGGGFL